MIILSSIIIILSCVISIKETDYEEAVIGRLTIECMMDDKAIRLVLWKDESEDRFYLFLPSWYAKKDKSMTFRYEDWIGVLRLDGETVRNRDVWTDDGNEEIHTLEVYDRKGVCHLESTLQVLTSENLPALFVTVEDRKDLLKFEKFDNKKYIEAGSDIVYANTFGANRYKLKNHSVDEIIGAGIAIAKKACNGRHWRLLISDL